MRWSMKRYPACAIVVFLLALPAVSAAQSEKVAFYALKKMEARLEKPISLREYSRLLKETKSSVDPYLRTSEAGTDGDMSLLMANVMSHYGNIGFIRKEAIMGPYIHLDPARVRMYSAKSIAKARNFSALLEQYPEADKPVEEGGALDRDPSDRGRDFDQLRYGPVLDLHRFLPIVERKNAQDLDQLTKTFLLRHAETPEGKSEIQKLLLENRQLKEENKKLRDELDLLKSGLQNSGR